MTRPVLEQIEIKRLYKQGKKRCSACCRNKPLEEFRVRKDTKTITGRQSWCKECCNKQKKDRYKKNLPESRARGRKNYNKNNDNWKQNTRKRYLERAYGITEGDYNLLYESQNGCCAICSIPEIECTQRLNVDHDHETDEIRGLLCWNCNIMLGYAKDDINILKKAAHYLGEI